MKILLVEDDPRLAHLIVEGLSDEGFLLDHASNTTEALSMVETFSHDVLVLDVMLPEGKEAGFELARHLRAQHNPTPILFLTARADMDSKLTGLEMGGDDYLSKPFDFRELRARVRALLRRSKGVSSNLLPLPGGFMVDLAAHEVLLGAEPVALTPREYSLLECFALNPGRAYSREALIERVWPEDTLVETKIVDVYISTVRRKTSERVIETVRGVGYRLGRV